MTDAPGQQDAPLFQSWQLSLGKIGFFMEAILIGFLLHDQIQHNSSYVDMLNDGHVPYRFCGYASLRKRAE